MTPSDLRAARAQLDLSTAGLARALKMGAHGERTVRHWERGDYAPSGPAQVAIRLMLEREEIERLRAENETLETTVADLCAVLRERCPACPALESETHD